MAEEGKNNRRKREKSVEKKSDQHERGKQGVAVFSCLYVESSTVLAARAASNIGRNFN